MTTCQGCAADLADDVRYCPHCGLPAGTQPPELPRWQREPVAEMYQPPSWSNRPPDGLDEDNEELLAGTERPNRRRRALITAGVALVAIVVAVVVGLNHGGGSSPSVTAPLAADPGAPGNGTLPTPTVVRSGTGPIPPLNLVGVAPAVPDSPELDTAREVLNRYFLAINAHNDYQGWRDTLVPKPGRGTLEDYKGYQTTQDTDISINAVHRGSNGQVRVSVSFTSRQDPKLGNGHSCLLWWISFSLRPYQDKLRIDVNGISKINVQSC